MKNAPATFYCMIYKIIRDYETYIDEVIVFGRTWEEYLSIVKELLRRLKESSPTMNLVTSKFGHAYVTYLGQIVGQDQVRPVTVKV